MGSIRYSYIKQHRQLIISCQGEVEGENFVDELNLLFQKPFLDDKLTILLDTRNMCKKASLQANKLYTKFFAQDHVFQRIQRVVIVADHPDQVVQAIIFKDNVEALIPAIKIFNAIENALEWIHPISNAHTILNLVKILSSPIIYRRAA